jgi:glycosyltransferase involved in cell wall biosynthesis
MNKKKISIFSSNNKKKLKRNKTLISVVTIVYNDEKNIEKTIKSVLNQKYSFIEYIVVYTPSQDRTFEIIKKYKKKIDKIIVSEKRGIFLAMNIGTFFAKGKYLNFMNSGDYFTSSNTVYKLFNKKQNVDVIYGDCIIYYDNYLRKIKCSGINTINKELPFSHQSSFVRTNLQKKYKFNLKHGQSADYDFFLKIFLQKKKFKYYPFYISNRLPYGNSDKKIETLYDNYWISSKYLGKPTLSRKLIFLKEVIYYSCTKILQYILPRKILNLIIKLKY